MTLPDTSRQRSPTSTLPPRRERSTKSTATSGKLGRDAGFVVELIGVQDKQDCSAGSSPVLRMNGFSRPSIFEYLKLVP